MSRIMQRLSISSFLLGIITTTIFFAVLLVFNNLSHEISKPDGWHGSIKGWINTVSQDVSVHDVEEHRHLFWYDEDGPIRATKVEKISSSKWIVTIENTSVQDSSK